MWTKSLESFEGTEVVAAETISLDFRQKSDLVRTVSRCWSEKLFSILSFGLFVRRTLNWICVIIFSDAVPARKGSAFVSVDCICFKPDRLSLNSGVLCLRVTKSTKTRTYTQQECCVSFQR